MDKCGHAFRLQVAKKILPRLQVPRKILNAFAVLFFVTAFRYCRKTRLL